MPCGKARRALRLLGFNEDKGKGTSHQQWRKVVKGHLFKVTLDCHKGEVKAKDVRSMIAQAGVTAKEFYEASENVKGEPKSHADLSDC